MKIKKMLRALFCGLMIMSICGCSAGISVENMLTAPKLDSEQSAIYQALINSVGSGVKLKYPKSGDYRSAFVLKNIDGEEGDEALVFYESQTVQSGESALRLKILDKDGGSWSAVYDIACVGSEVDSISFARLGDTENVDIIICYSLLNQSEKLFSVLNYSDGIPVELFSSTYACLEVIDLNADGSDELVCVVNDKANKVSTAMMFTNSEEGFVKLSETQLGGEASDYVRTVKGQLSESTTALFLDYSRGAGKYGTDVVYCYGNRLVTPEGGAGLISRFTNDYMADIPCSDIDNDGFIEIPSTTPLPGYETLTRPEQLCAVRWYTVNDDNFTMEHYSYFSSKYSFALLFPNRWQGVVSAVVNFADNEIVFISYSVDTGLEVNEKTELMRIRAVDKNDAEGLDAAKGMRVLGESGETVYCCSESADYLTGNLALTESELENCFIIL
ncbi:MAG: hypothetical protein K2O14_00830 [Oscillospiraceae bacterium]|nr:hypothetical protein [Oscillospiraceae bacterium]